MMVDERKRTVRYSGAVGKNAALPKYIAALLSYRNDIRSVLDFGAGNGQHAELLKAEHPIVTVDTYDLGMEKPNRVYDLVYASNVVNVQRSIEELESTLSEIWHFQKDRGEVYINYPSSPRYAGLTLKQLKVWIRRLDWWDVYREDSSVPIFRLVKR